MLCKLRYITCCSGVLHKVGKWKPIVLLSSEPLTPTVTHSLVRMSLTQAVLGFLEAEIVNPTARFVERIAFEMPKVTDLTDTYKGTWYLSPRQHTIEFVGFNVLFFVLFRVGLHLFRKKG